MRSRLGCGLVADIHPTTYELRLGILQTKAEHARVPVPLEGAGVPGAQDHHQRPRARRRAEPHRRARPADRPRDHARDGAGGAARPARARPTAGSRSTRSRSRWPSTTTSSWPRCTRRGAPARSPGRARWRCISPSSSPPCSLPEIGRRFGGRDHTTVMHAVRKIEELAISDSELRRGCRTAHARMLAGLSDNSRLRFSSGGRAAADSRWHVPAKTLQISSDIAISGPCARRAIVRDRSASGLPRPANRRRCSRTAIWTLVTATRP